MNGEDNKDESHESEFYEWMMSQKASKSLVNTLIENSIDTFDALKTLGEIHEYFEEATKEMGIQIMDKIKLKTIMKNIPKKHAIVYKEETEAIQKMEKKLLSIKDLIHLAGATKQKIDEQIAAHTIAIKAVFEKCHQLLTEREANLIKKLNEIGIDKKNKLENTSKTLTKQSTFSEQIINSCHKRLSKSIELNQIEARKVDILKLAEEIADVQIMAQERNNIDIVMNETLIVETINSFCEVTGGVIPVLLAVTDNKDATITMKWKLFGTQNNSNNHKVNVQWKEIKAKDGDHKEFDGTENDNEWTNQEINYKLISFQDINESRINVINKNATFAFKMRYYNYNDNKWSNYSNIMSVKVEYSQYTFFKFNGSYVKCYGKSFCLLLFCLFCFVSFFMICFYDLLLIVFRICFYD